MKNKKIITTTILVLAMLFSVIGCSKKDDSASKEQANEPEVTITVSAAASLKDAMTELQTLYKKEKSNVAITYNFGSSGSLQQQIEQGAPADIFMSAAQKQMTALTEKDLILKDSKKDLLENKVVLITAKDNTNIKDFSDLTSDSVKKVALGETKSVPVGQYSEEALKKLGIFDKIQGKTVYAKDVKEVLAWVETGNADVGMVYATDAKVSDKVKVVKEAEEGSYTKAIYPVAVLKDSKNLDAAKAFVDFISSDSGKAIFEKYGFSALK